MKASRICLVLVLATSSAIVACSSSDSEKPAPAQLQGDASPFDASGHPSSDASPSDADATTDAMSYDAGVGPQCPPTGSTNRPGIVCAPVGDASTSATADYKCDDSHVFGALWRCNDEDGMPTRPAGVTCVATARNSDATTDYLCSPEVCMFDLLNATCNGAGNIALLCPKGIMTKPSCPTIPDDAGTSSTDNFCCPK